MASLSWQVKAYLISKGKTEEESAAFFANEPAEIELIDHGSGPEILTWNVSGITKPTNSQLTAVNTEATKLETNHAVKKKRRREYNSLGDQLDQLYWDKKNGTNKWVEAIDKVKSDNPKP